MAEIYTAPRDEKAFLSLIEKKLNKKDYLSALSLINLTFMHLGLKFIIA